MSDASLPSEQPCVPDQSATPEQSGGPEQSNAPEQPGTQAFPIIVSAAPAKPTAGSELAINDPTNAVDDPSEAFALASELTLAQQRAFQQLISGVSISQTSKATGVPVRSISGWVNNHPKFIAALNAWKRDQLESGRASMLAMTDDIGATLRSGVRQGNTNIAFRMADKMGMLAVSNPGPTDADEIERRRQIRLARTEDQLHDAEHKYDLDLRDRAEREDIAWSKRAMTRLSYDEQSLLKFLRDKAAGREHRDCTQFSPLDHDRHLTPWERNVLIKARGEAVLEGNILFQGNVLPTPRGANGVLIHYSKRHMFDMLLKGGVKEDEALRLLAHYRRPYPGFYEPNDLPYAEDEESGEGQVAPAPEQAPD